MSTFLAVKLLQILLRLLFKMFTNNVHYILINLVQFFLFYANFFLLFYDLLHFCKILAVTLFQDFFGLLLLVYFCMLLICYIFFVCRFSPIIITFPNHSSCCFSMPSKTGLTVTSFCYVFYLFLLCFYLLLVILFSLPISNFLLFCKCLRFTSKY